MAVDTDRAACPDSEQLARYVDRRLPPHERAVLEAHLVECADCRAVLADATAFADSMPAEEEPDVARRWRPWLQAAALAAAAVLVIVLGRDMLQRQQASDRPELQDLVSALRDQPSRPSEGRLTGGFGYAPPPSSMRAQAPVDAAPTVRIAVAAIEREARRSQSIGADAALGIAYLVNGDVDRSIETLERSTRARPADARFWSDLAAAYLHRGVRKASSDDFEKAREAAERALVLDTGLGEAMFNRAAALERLGRTDQARTAWMSVSAADPESPWAREAAERARTLVVPQ